MIVPRIESARLVLRGWTLADLEPFAAMNADPQVMEHFPSTLSHQQSDELVDWIVADFERDGFGLWALEVRETAEFIGFTGLSVPSFEALFTPAVEIGWRLAKSAWGNGFATEAATAALDFGFNQTRLSEVVSFTSVTNLRSQAVMHRLGMTRNSADDFEHPNIQIGHRLRPHVLYRMSRELWTLQRADS
ncbi:MAG TPA: GNAT family N-acetyltransferase [Acidimicrobiales bacterium]|nr:GNAT family N-acetyltransferase [Acidimicrobiales bacterium]